jgi:hypothetical protein
MKFKGFILVILIASLFLLSKCYYDSKEYLYPELSTSCDTSNYTFSGAVKPILQANCLSCHSNASAPTLGSNVKLEDYTDVKDAANSGMLMGTIKHLNGYQPMPYNGGSLSNCNITLIQKWIDAQTPNN